MAATAGLVNCLRGLLADFIAFLVHDVTFERLALDRREGGQTDMQGQKSSLHTAQADLFEHLLTKMQPGRRRGYRTGRLRENCLVPLPVELHVAWVGAVNVRRQWDFT